MLTGAERGERAAPKRHAMKPEAYGPRRRDVLDRELDPDRPPATGGSAPSAEVLPVQYDLGTCSARRGRPRQRGSSVDAHARRTSRPAMAKNDLCFGESELDMTEKRIVNVFRSPANSNGWKLTASGPECIPLRP